MQSHLFAFLVLLVVAATTTDENLPPDAKADRVVVMKKERTLTLMSGGKVLKTYKIALGSHALGPKQQEGDHKTPEGMYILDRRNPKSRFYRSIHISYPNQQDKARARRMGVSPGGDVMVHGLRNGLGWLGAAHVEKDWTDGCIAVTDREMDEIWGAVPDGTPIEIEP